MGRAPCCDKVGLKKGRWTTEEDEILKNYIQTHGEGSWRSLPKNAGLLRCGKSCRLRWINYLRTDVKRGNITPEEEDIIVKLHATMGNRWSLIAGHLPGRTDNEIKNHWNSHLSRKIHYFRKSYTKTTTTVETMAAPGATLAPPKRRGGRVSRAAMKKNKHLYNNKATVDKDKNKDTVIHGANYDVINNNINATTGPTGGGTEPMQPYMNNDQDQYLYLCDGLVGPPGSGLGLDVEDHCTRDQMVFLDDQTVGPVLVEGVINGGIQAESCSNASSSTATTTTTSSSQFGEYGGLEWDPYDHHEFDQLWMNMEEEGSNGGEEQQIISWLWDNAEEDSGLEGANSVQSAKELDAEKQEAMMAWLMS